MVLKQFKSNIIISIMNVYVFDLWLILTSFLLGYSLQYFYSGRPYMTFLQLLLQ